MMIKDAILQYSNELNDISDSPRLDIELLIRKVLGDVDKLYIHLNLNKDLTNEEKSNLIDMVNQRKKGRPMAYILGTREFMGLDFSVKEGVLIPRPDTEILVEEVINLCKDVKNPVILDIGTGSGAITVSLAKYIYDSKVYSFDISDIALEVGKTNAINNNVDHKISFIKSNLFDSIKDKNILFDVIVSNPPYIRKNDMPTLHTQVKDYEPYIALEGGEDGLDFYKKITKESIKYLKENGILAYEVGHDQAIDVKDIMIQNGYHNITIHKDLSNIDRVVIGRKI
jgi:release factor glutamine methyltransferase